MHKLLGKVNLRGITSLDNQYHPNNFFPGYYDEQYRQMPQDLTGIPSQGGFPIPGGGGKQTGAPTTPPPSVIPQESVGAFAVDPGAIRRCLFRFTYVWLNNGRSFWLYPTFVGRNSVAGFRWRRNRWEYYGTDLRRIRSFRCF